MKTKNKNGYVSCVTGWDLWEISVKRSDDCNFTLIRAVIIRTGLHGSVCRVQEKMTVVTSRPLVLGCKVHPLAIPTVARVRFTPMSLAVTITCDLKVSKRSCQTPDTCSHDFISCWNYMQWSLDLPLIKLRLLVLYQNFVRSLIQRICVVCMFFLHNMCFFLGKQVKERVWSLGTHYHIPIAKLQIHVKSI